MRRCPDLEIPADAPYSALRERTNDLHLEWRVLPFSRNDAGNDGNVEYLFDDHLVIVARLHSRWVRRRKIDLAEPHAEPLDARPLRQRRFAPEGSPCRRALWKPSVCRCESTFL